MSAEPDIVQELRKHASGWCFQEHGEDGNLWTQGSFLPTDAADEIERLRNLLRDVYDVTSAAERISDGLLDRIRCHMARGE